jgi:hypothetical protein
MPPTKRVLHAMWRTPYRPNLHVLRVGEPKIRAIVHLAPKNLAKAQEANDVVKPKADNLTP